MNEVEGLRAGKRLVNDEGGSLNLAVRLVQGRAPVACWVNPGCVRPFREGDYGFDLRSKEAAFCAMLALCGIPSKPGSSRDRCSGADEGASEGKNVSAREARHTQRYDSRGPGGRGRSPDRHFNSAYF